MEKLDYNLKPGIMLLQPWLMKSNLDYYTILYLC